MCSMTASNARASPGSWSGASCPNSGRISICLHLVLPGPVPGGGLRHREGRPADAGGRQVEGTPRAEGLPPAAGRSAPAAHGAAAGHGAVPNGRELSGREGHARGEWVEDARAPINQVHGFNFATNTCNR